MTQKTLKALAAVALLIVATAPAQAYTGWQVGTWARTATVDDHEVRVKLELTENTIHCTVRSSEGSLGVTITIDADYVISRDGTLIGILAPTKGRQKTKKTNDDKEDLNNRILACRLDPEKNALVLKDVTFGDQKDIAKVIAGKYHKVETKSHLPTAPAVTPTAPAPPQAAPTTPAPSLDTRTSVRFVEPVGMKVSWMVGRGDNKRDWSDKPLEAPATYSFAQGAVYRLKLGNIAGHPGLELFPTLEVVPGSERTGTFLAHNSVPVEFTADELRGSKSGNYVVKVIYLPKTDLTVETEVIRTADAPPWQVLKLSGGLGAIVSTDAGVDPIKEATRRGTILAVVRLGNIDLEKPPPIPTLPLIPRVSQ
jgi:hypothetical protein